MTTTIKVSSNGAASMYGKASTGDQREVQCLQQASTTVFRTAESDEVNATFDLYCNDIDVKEGDVIELPDGSHPPILGIDTYNDAHGPLYQVVHC